MQYKNIVFAADRGYIQHLSVALVSLIKNNPDSFFNVYIINTDINAEEWELLKSLDKDKKHHFFNAKIDDKVLENLVINFHFTKANYYRLFIPEIVPYDKAIYIDADVVVKGDLNELWNTPIDHVYLAAVEDVGFDRHTELEMHPNSKYFNSGVMVMNLNKWREEGVKNRVIEFVKRKPNAVQFVDQCGLNAIVDGRWFELHPKFNMQTAFLELVASDSAKLVSIDILNAVKKPVIIHYTGGSKPWHFTNTHPYKKEYWKYLKNTPFKRTLPADVTLKNLLIRFVPKSAKRFLKNILRWIER